MNLALVVLFVVGLFAGVGIHRWFVQQDIPAATQTAAIEHCESKIVNYLPRSVRAVGSNTETRERAPQGSARDEPVARPDPQAERVFRELQSKDLIDLLRLQESIASKTPAFGSDPEWVAAQVVPYMRGAADAIAKTSPELVEELSKEVENSLCNSESRPGLQLVMSRMTGTMPELATSRGYDCIFDRAKNEDVVTWQTLDAWRGSGLPKTASIEKLEKEAKDPRTLRRLDADGQKSRAVAVVPTESPADLEVD